MKFITTASLALALVFQAAVAQYDAIRLSFADTQVSQVLKAISLRTGASIVYSDDSSDSTSGGKKHLISLDIKAGSIEDAIKSVASAAGLRMRKVGSTYVVASNMQKALAPYSYTAQFTITSDPQYAVQLVTSALPFSVIKTNNQKVTESGKETVHETYQTVETVLDATVKSVGDKIWVTGVPEDIAIARRILASIPPSAAMSPMVTHVVSMASGDPASVVKMLSTNFPKLKVSAVSSQGTLGEITSSIVLTGPEDDVDAAEQIVQQSSSAPEAIVYKVYHIKYSNAATIIDFLKSAAPDVQCIPGPQTFAPMPPSFKPISASALSGNSSSAGGTASSTSGATGSTTAGYISTDQSQNKYDPTDRATTVALKGPNSSVAAALQLLEQLDVKPQQVAIEVKVVDTTPEVTAALGLDHLWAPFAFFETPPGTGWTVTGNGAVGTVPTQFTSKPTGFGQFSRAPWSFQSTLSASIVRQETKVLASPNIMVTDNDQANIFVGDTLRVQLAQASVNGQTTTVQEFPVGIIMLIRPRINADGNITLRIHPSVSSITAVDKSSGIPQTSEREADTNVVTKDNETIVIGGLIRDEDTRTVSEIPILGQIPILGELFRSRTHDKKRKEVLVFITTHIVKDGENPFGPDPKSASKEPELPNRLKGLEQIKP